MSWSGRSGVSSWPSWRAAQRTACWWSTGTGPVASRLTWSGWLDAHLASGALVESVSDSIHLRGSDADITMARIMVAIAWQESADKARRVKAARKRGREAGSYGGGQRPFGFRTTAQPGVLAEVPAEVEVIDAMVKDVAAAAPCGRLPTS